MNKHQKLVQQAFLDDEERIISRLETVYKKTLDDVIKKSKELQEQINSLGAILDMTEDDDQKAVIKSMQQSKIYQKQYQDALKKQISAILDAMQVEEFKTVDEYLRQCYENGFIGTMYDLHGQGIPLCMPIDQEAMVRAVQTDSKISQGLYTRLGEDVSLLKRKITAQVSRGISSGFTYAQMAQQLSAYTNIGLNNAIRITRTEGHRIQSQSTMDACYKAKDMGADIVKQWDATLDRRTRRSHTKVDGEIRELDEAFSNGLMFPSDPSGRASEVINCRCALLERARWALDEGELETLKKRAEYYGLDKTDNFEDFKKKYLKVVETPAAHSDYNSKTMNAQYKLTDILSESEYYSETEEAFRLSAIKELTGVDDGQAEKYLEALCGTRNEYVRLMNASAANVYKESWFFGGDADIRAGITDANKKTANIIHDYIMKAPKYEGEIYRGMSLDKRQIESFKTGAIFEENGTLSSWSSSKDVADMFAEGRSEELGLTPVILKTRNPKYGTPVSHLSIYGQDECEVLVSNIANSKYTIGEVTEVNGVVVVELL